MTTDYNLIAQEYKSAKLQPWRMHIEHFSLFQLLGDLRGKRVLDLACGEGFITRSLRQAGASRVVGVDLSSEMIRLAREEESRRPLGVEYRVGDVKELRLEEQFDVVTAAYLLNYAATEADLVAMCQSIASALRPGGRFVTVNNNPAQPPTHFADSAKYGFTKRTPGDWHEGAPIIFTIFLDAGPLEITNYYLSCQTHERAMNTAGLEQVRWHCPRVAPSGIAEYGQDYWANFLTQPPVIFLEAVAAGQG